MFFRKRIPVRYAGRFFSRDYSGRKGSPGRNHAPFLLTISLILAIILLISPLGAEVFLIPGNFKTILAGKMFNLDYLTLISNALPGLAFRGGTARSDNEAGAGAGAHLHPPLWQDYPQMLLHNELAGLQVLAAAQSSQPSAAGEDASAPGQKQNADESTAVFLTGKKLDPAREKPFTLEDEEQKPLLLIYHTHTSESFLPVSGKIYATAPEQTVVFLGAALAQTLQEDYHLPVLHCQEVFDQPRSKAYQRACPAIEKILEENPQIRVVLDLHRDGVSRKITTANVSGQDTARVLFVIETRHQGWASNLRFALFLENFLEKKCPGFSRGILKNVFACYNQHLHPRSLIVEIGGHENNKEELLRAIPYLAEALSGAFEQ